MTHDDLRLALRSLLETQRTLVLATADPAPWSAPVYFVRHDDRLCFFSSSRSRHIEATRDGRPCAGAVYRDGDDWRDIAGAQMVGRVEGVAPGPSAQAVLAAYIAKFPTVRTLLSDRPAEVVPDLATFQARFRSDLFAFVPEEVHCLDNRLGFAARHPVPWPA